LQRSHRTKDKLFKQVLAAFSAATTGGFLSLNPGLDDIGSAADSRGDADGAGRTILGACATFHTSIKIIDFGFFTIHSKYRMGANTFTHTAANTRLRIKFQRCNPL
jgi:hypothetical protein